MKKLTICLLILAMLCGCTPAPQARIAATTLPVYQFTQRITAGTDLTVTRLVTENVSCLHDYTLSVNDMKVLESADLILLNGAGLEDSMADALAASGTTRIDCAEAGEVTHLDTCHVHDHGESTGVVSPQDDPHIWMDPMRACQMIQGIVKGLSGQDPAHAEAYAANGEAAVQALTAAYEDWSAQLADLTCRELILTRQNLLGFLHNAGILRRHCTACSQKKC